jgi:hypothetical protein
MIPCIWILYSQRSGHSIYIQKKPSKVKGRLDPFSFCKKGGAENILPPSAAHNGNAVIECGYGSGKHPGSAWPYQN